MLLLKRSDIESLLTMNDTIQRVEEGFAALSSGRVIMPQRAVTPVEAYGGIHLSMPAFVSGDPGTLTIKIVTVYPDNPSLHSLSMVQGVILLHDAQNGRLLAIMDAEHITAMRTGASSGVATKYMARTDAKRLTLFGAGAQAGAQLEAVCSVRNIQQAFVLTRTGEKDEAFAAAQSIKLGIDVQHTRNVQKAVEQADIVCTATNSVMPLFEGQWLQPGVHINAVGAYKRTMRELDAETIQRSRIIVDNHTAAQSEAGDIAQAILESQGEKGTLNYDHVAGELGDVVLGKLPGRTSPEETTLFKSVGLAMQDAVTVAHLYARAVAAGIGQQIEL